MIGHLLNQSAFYLAAYRNEDGSPQMNDRGDIVYCTAIDIPCRRESCMKEVTLPDKEVINITDTFYTEMEIRAGDILEGKRVQYVEDWVDGAGNIIGYKSIQ